MADQRAATYSGGLRRRLDIAMSLIGDPPVLFLDEPTTGLDPQSRIEVRRTVRALAENGTTVLLTTQYLDEAEQLADRIAILHQGRIIADGTLAELKKLIEWPADDPRLIGVVDHLVTQFEGASDTTWDDDPLPDDLAALLDAVFVKSVPAARRVLQLLEDRGWTGWTKVRRLENGAIEKFPGRTTP